MQRIFSMALLTFSLWQSAALAEELDFVCEVETALADQNSYHYEITFSLDVNEDTERFELIDGARITVDHVVDDTVTNYLLAGRAEINQTLTTIRGTVTQSVYGLMFEIESYKSQKGLNFDVNVRHKLYENGEIYTSPIVGCERSVS